MLSKTFQTIFKIGAKYTGHPAFAAVNRDIDRTQRNAKMSAAMIGGLRTAYTGLFRAASLGAAATAGVVGVVGYKAFRAAKDVRKSQDVVRQANERLVAQGRLSSKDVEKRTQETIALAEAMEQAGGIDAEVLMEGFSELSKSMGSERIEKMSKGLQDWLVTVHKGAPTNEQMIDSMQKINEAIFRGKVRGLQDLGLTKEQTKAIGKLTTTKERRLAIEKLLSKETGAMAAWMKTDAGATYRLERATESWLERAGKPMAKVSRQMTEALIKLVKAMDPVADAIADQLEPRLQDLVIWIEKNSDSIAAFAKGAVNWFWWMNDQFWKMSDASKNFFKPIVDNTQKEWENLQKGWEAAKTGLGAFPDFFAQKWDETLTATGLKHDQLVKLYDSLPQQIKDALAPVGKIIMDAFKPALDYVIEKSGQVAKEFDKIPAQQAITRPTTGGIGTTAEDISDQSGLPLKNEFAPYQRQLEQERGPDPDALIPDAPTTSSRVPTGSSLKDTIRKMSIKDRLSGSGGTNVANINPTINVHGVEPGREKLTANAIAKAIKDPIRAGLDNLRKMQNEDMRTGYV